MCQVLLRVVFCTRSVVLTLLSSSIIVGIIGIIGIIGIVGVPSAPASGAVYLVWPVDPSKESGSSQWLWKSHLVEILFFSSTSLAAFDRSSPNNSFVTGMVLLQRDLYSFFSSGFICSLRNMFSLKLPWPKRAMASLPMSIIAPSFCLASDFPAMSNIID